MTDFVEVVFTTHRHDSPFFYLGKFSFLLFNLFKVDVSPSLMARIILDRFLQDMDGEMRE